MREFKDSSGAKWAIDLAIGQVMRVKKASENRFNLFESKDLGERLQLDEAEFWELLWFLIEPQAIERKVSGEKFGQDMAADCLHDARRLFFDEWQDFFRQLHRLENAAVVEALAKNMAEAMAMVQKKLEAEGPALQRRVNEKMQATLNSEFGKLLASLESTPNPSPPGNSGDSPAEPGSGS